MKTEIIDGKKYKRIESETMKCDGCAFDGSWDGCQFPEDEEPYCSEQDIIFIEVKH